MGPPNLQQAGTLSFQVSFNPKNQVIASGYVYDADGNMVGNGTYTYNGENQIANTVGRTYTYDAAGERIRKDTGGNTNVTEYIYFGGEPIAERDFSGNWTDYIFAGSKRIAQATGSTSAGTKFFHADALGSARLMTDGNGAQIFAATYLPFGRMPQTSLPCLGSMLSRK